MAEICHHATKDWIELLSKTNFSFVSQFLKNRTEVFISISKKHITSDKIKALNINELPLYLALEYIQILFWSLHYVTFREVDKLSESNASF